ncbi:MAG: hypothetical protein ACRD1J_11185 [Terriglobia bacterium]
MSRSIRFVLALIIGVAVNAAAGPPQENVRPVPAATFSEFHCTGFISSSQMPATIRVFNGADNDFDEALQEFTSKDYIYLRRTDHQVFHVGDAYSIIRSETGFLLNPAWLPGKIQNQILPPASAYPFQRYDIKKLGRPYDNTGLVRVVKLTPQGAIAKVVFTCNGIYPQDIAVPYQPKPIPFFIPNTRLDRFALPNGKLQGIIVADSTASDILARGSIAFLNIGRTQGVAASQRYHIFAISRQVPVKGLEGLFGRPQSPRETIGELVILHVRQKSSVGVIVNSLRQIAIGDGVELE